MSDVKIEWPREIWMAEREEHDQGVVSAVLSEWATVARFEGDVEREKEFHRYVDGDIFDSQDKYWRARLEAVIEERNVQNDLRQIAEDAADELRARLDAVEKDRNEWRDLAASYLTQKSEAKARAERAEAALAQIEPRDGERWVTPDMIQYQYEWMEWLAGDQPLVPIDDLRAVQAALALRNGECEAKKIIIAQLEATLATARRDAELLNKIVLPMVEQRSREQKDAWDQAAAAIRALANEAET